MSAPADRQYLRQCSLVVGGAGGKGLELGALRVVFATHKVDFETPNHADIRVYNLAEATCARLGTKEFTRIVLQAGYEGNCGLIFGGTIRQVRFGRENGVDTYADFLASDGDRAYNYAVVRATLAAGATQKDVAKTAAGAMAEHGVTQGYIPDLGGQALPRGQVMYGMARDYLRDVAHSTDTSWSIQDGKVQLVPKRGYLPGEAVKLTAETGLIGMPEQTEQGIMVRCLINPKLRVGGRIKLDNRSIIRFKQSLKIGAFQKAPRINKDGFYRILAIEWRGDTRGNDWYADLTCVGIDDSAPLLSKIVVSNGGR
jgi:hypothetical protein